MQQQKTPTANTVSTRRRTSAPRAHYATKPTTLRRNIQHVRALPDEIHLFTCHSMTRAGKTFRHDQEVDLITGEVRCSCEDFTFRHASHEPRIENIESHCKHLVRALDWLQRHKFLALDRWQCPCSFCGSQVADSYYPVANDAGEAVEGVICIDCIDAAQSPEPPDWDCGCSPFEDCGCRPDALALPCPPYIDPATGEIRDGWFQVPKAFLGFAAGEWVTEQMVEDRRAITV